MRGVELHREGSLEPALVEYGKALRAYPKYVQALETSAQSLILYNHPESALTFLRRAHDLDDCNVVVNLKHCDCVGGTRDYTGA